MADVLEFIFPLRKCGKSDLPDTPQSRILLLFSPFVGGGGAGRPVYGRRDGPRNDVTRLEFPLNGLSVYLYMSMCF